MKMRTKEILDDWEGIWGPILAAFILAIITLAIGGIYSLISLVFFGCAWR